MTDADVSAPTRSFEGSAAVPVSFGGDFAFYHPAGGQTGYVLCGTWGYDEMCSRKFLRSLADDFAAAGSPSLRFDYPGTVNMRDVDDGPDLNCWVSAAEQAAERLKQISNAKQIVFLGFGIGTAVAFLAGTRRSDTAGLILAVPTPNGRRYMRELQLQAKVSDETLGIDLSGPHRETGFTGFFMQERLQESLKGFKLSPENAGAKLPTLVLCRDENVSERAFTEELANAGWQVETGPFKDYLKLIGPPINSFLPDAVMDQIMGFSHNHFAEADAKTVPPLPADNLAIATGTYREEPVRFGQNQRFFGVLCQPLGERRGPVIVFLNTAYCHHAGWGRIYVRAARYLAERGIASFRFDMANIGESPPTGSRSEQILYTNMQIEDAGEALSFLISRNLGPRVVVGRCSGAYVAFCTAAANRDADGVMMINQLRMVWDTEDDVYEAVNFGARPLEEYRRRAASLTSFKRLLRGEIDVQRAAGHIVNHLADRLVRRAAPYLGSLTKLGRFRKICLNRFAAMASRRIPVEILNCETDGSLDELTRYFGSDLSGLDNYPNVRRTVIHNADHNLTPEPAQVFLQKHLERFATDPVWKGR